MAKGTIYFVQGGAGGPIKIGYTGNLDRRLTSIRGHSPVAVQVLATCIGDLVDEARLHERFAAHRLHGEWFAPAEELLAAIASGNPLASCRPLQGGLLPEGEAVKKFEMSMPATMRKEARELAAAEGLGLVPWLRRLIESELSRPSDPK